MIFRRPGFVGLIAGLIAAMLVISRVSPHRPAAPVNGPTLAEHGGSLHSLAMQYTEGSAIVWPVYRQFLQYQPAGVTVYMVCPASADFDEIRHQIGDVKCAITPIYTHHPITSWARDRWVQLAPSSADEAITLLAPKGELQQEIWPQRAGDSQVADDLAKTLKPAFRFQRSSLYFDGGDLLADDESVFVTPAVLRRNLQHTADDRQELIRQLESDLHRTVIVMDDAPDHHAGMYMMAAGNRRMVVGDPSLGSALINADDPNLSEMEIGPDFSPQTQQHFDAVARLASEHGYQVTRIPTVPGQNGKQYLTYVNVIMDIQDGRQIVYMPTYRDQPRLNAAAQRVWESLGYQVLPVDCTTVWPQGGTLHCLVNVLERRG